MYYTKKHIEILEQLHLTGQEQNLFDISKRLLCMGIPQVRVGIENIHVLIHLINMRESVFGLIEDVRRAGIIVKNVENPHFNTD